MKTDLFDQLVALPSTYGGLNSLQGDLMYLLGCGGFPQFVNTFKGLIDPANHCPFCTDARRGSPKYGWYLKPNDFRGGNMKAMLLAIPNRHITDPRELRPSDWVGMGAIFEKALNEYQLEGGILAMRFGDPRFHSGTIPHLHANIIAPTGEDEYRVPVSKTHEQREANYKRLLAHRTELLDKGGFTFLFPETN